MSLCWSGEIRVLRKHSARAGAGSELCPGAGRPAVGEVTNLPRPTPPPGQHVPEPSGQHVPNPTRGTEPVASVA